MKSAALLFGQSKNFCSSFWARCFVILMQQGGEPVEYSDSELIAGIKSGNKDALDQLIRRWYPRIYGYIFKIVAHEQDAYDITQDVFISMLQNLQAFHPWKKFHSWLFTIAHNKCMDYFRLKKRVTPTDVMDWDKQDPAPLLDDRVTVSVTVEKALTQLSAAQREAVILHYFYQFTAKEISHMTHTPLPTVKSRLSSAKRLLSKLLREGFL